MTRPEKRVARPSFHWSGELYEPDRTPRLGVVIVNYRGADDTIECLESLLRCPLPMRVVVVENGSGDDSAERITAWAQGHAPANVADPTMAALSTPPLPKPLPFRQLGPVSIGTLADGGKPAERFSLIVSPNNLGFAGGNNLGLRHLLADPALTCFWLLNNDTVVSRDAPAALLNRMMAGERMGMCGTIVRHYWAPDRLQALGGFSFNLLTGNATALGGEAPATVTFDPQVIADATDFVLGASLAVSRDFLTDVGLMAEEYFLYFEEIDWAVRNRRLGGQRYEIGFAHGATIFHKAGRAIGSPNARARRSAFSDYWLTRARLRFIWRHYRPLWPWHWLLGWAVAARRLLRRQPANARAVIRATLGRDL
jgi:GT2 family glycosyltransferase